MIVGNTIMVNGNNLKNIKSYFANRMIFGKYGGFILLLSKPYFKKQNKLHRWERYNNLRFGLTYEKNNKCSVKGNILIKEGEWNYKYFNVCFLNNMLANILDSLRMGFIPIIDLSNREKGDVNWDTFFEQPFYDKIESTATDMPIIYTKKVADYTPGFFSHKDNIELSVCRTLYRNFVVFNKETKDYIENEYNQLLYNKGRILGVLCRGTDYTTMNPKGHPIQPSVEKIIETVKDLIEKELFSGIYLATEEKKIHNAFEEAFPGKIIVNKRVYYDDQYYGNQNVNYIAHVHFDRENDNYYKGLEYLSSLYLLSKCNAFVGGNCGGSQAALYMNDGKYENWKIFDLGVYK
jgi:hypothetical protein